MYFYCTDPENIENYEAAKTDNFKGWVLHHRMETHFSNGERRPVDILMGELAALGMYQKRPSSELILLRKEDHNALHSTNSII